MAKKTRIRYTRDAVDDLDSIFDYISDDDRSLTRASMFTA